VKTNQGKNPKLVFCHSLRPVCRTPADRPAPLREKHKHFLSPARCLATWQSACFEERTGPHTLRRQNLVVPSFAPSFFRYFCCLSVPTKQTGLCGRMLLISLITYHSLLHFCVFAGAAVAKLDHLK